MLKNKRPYIEYDIVGTLPRQVISSKVRKATQEEIDADAAAHAAGKCPHNVIYDDAGYIYDERFCYTCGIFRSLI